MMGAAMPADEPDDATARDDADADDPIADDRDDPMAPPTEPCECWCMHCRRVFMSTGVWFQRIVGAPSDELQGMWMCPTPNCSGAGFTFDIFPTDPNHPANAGWSDDDEEEFVEEDDDDHAGAGQAESDWDPDESKWKELDEMLDGLEDGDDDLEGEEWKHGLQPGERPPEPAWMEQARREQEEQERQYDEPDRRPREVPWVDRGERGGDGQRSARSGDEWTEDDIPF
jgi:hypothetical protein